MILSAAYFLVFHGSRDCRTQAAASNLRQTLASKFSSILAQRNHLVKNTANFALQPAVGLYPEAGSLIDIAPLELSAIPLRESLVNFVQKASRQGINRVKVIPLFLGPGVHVQEDIPAEVTAALNQLDSQVTLELSPYLGKYSGMIPLLERQFAEFPDSARILIAHGTKLSMGALYYQNLVQRLDAEVGYWSTTPWFNEQIERQIALGQRRIALMPYFLFPGKITTAIAQKVASLQQQYPHVSLFLGEPLSETAALAELIAEEVQLELSR
ncbi:MAG: CbiX/SirB N-terminal domain-containing protein [Cyanobacteria bacterium J06621_8]